MKRIFITYIIYLLVSISVNAQSIDSLLLEKDNTKVMYKVLSRLEDKSDAEINVFINAFIDTCTKQEREYLKNQTIMRLYVASVPKEPTGELLSMMRNIGVLAGDQAPNFTLSDSTKLYDVLGKQTLLFFYEHSCNLCHNEMNELRSNQHALESKGITIISIDCNVEQTTPQPWQFNIADSMGAIYHPYGIISTPTFILLDKNGVIVGRYNKLANIELTAYPQYASLKLLTLWDGKRRKIPKGFPRISCSIFR